MEMRTDFRWAIVGSWAKPQFRSAKPRFFVAHDLPTMPTISRLHPGNGLLHSSPDCAYSTDGDTLSPL